MALRSLVRILGLCNAVAGALLLFAPTLVAPIDGIASPAAVLATRSAAVLLLAVAAAALLMPVAAAPPYLWVFGVAVKLIGAAVWAATAAETEVRQLWVGALVDAAVAAVIATGLLHRTDASR